MMYICLKCKEKFNSTLLLITHIPECFTIVEQKTQLNNDSILTQYLINEPSFDLLIECEHCHFKFKGRTTSDLIEILEDHHSIHEKEREEYLMDLEEDEEEKNEILSNYRMSQE